MFVLLQRRDRAELVLTVESQNDPALEAFMDRFNIAKACGSSFPSVSRLSSLSSQGTGSIAQLADSEFELSPPYQPSTPGTTPFSDVAQDTPSVLPYGSPMSGALSSPSPSPLPLDVEAESFAPAEDGSPDVGNSRPPSPDTAMEVIEDVSVEVLDEEPPPPSIADPDLPVDASVLPPPSTSSEAALAETRAETLAEDLSDVFEGTEETMDSIAPSEAGLVPPVVESVGDSRSEGLASPVDTEKIAVLDDMDVDVVGEPRAEADEPVLLTPERRSQSAVPLSPQASQTEAQTPPPPSPPLPAPAPVLALPPSAFVLPPRPSTEVFIPAALAPIEAPPQYSLDLTTVEPRSLSTTGWLNPEFSLTRNYTLPLAKSLPLDQQRRLKLGKSLRKKDKEKDKVLEGRKDGIDDWTPLGLNKWGVSIRANPLWKRVSRATKTMSTRDWNVRLL